MGNDFRELRKFWQYFQGAREHWPPPPPHPPSTHWHTTPNPTPTTTATTTWGSLISELSKTDQQLILKIKSLFHATVQDILQSKPCLQLHTCSFWDGWMDGWITFDFTSFSTVFQSYQDDVRLIMKSCVQWNSGDRTRSARSVGQRLTLWVTGAPYFLGKQLCHVHFAFLKETKKVDSVN